MDSESPFQLAGTTIAITAGASASTAVQFPAGVPTSGELSLSIFNSSTTNTNIAFLGWGPTAAAAQNNATIPTGATSVTAFQCIPIVPSATPRAITVPPGQFYSAIASAGTPVLYLSLGRGR